MRRSRCAAFLAAAGLVLGPSVVTASVAQGMEGPAVVSGARCVPAPDGPHHEMRGEWIASAGNIDWPSRPGLTPQQAQDELVAYYDDATARGLDAVYVQVRPTADTIWPSRLEPSSRWLTGRQGADFGGWDPMAFAVEQAHRRGLDFHAWFNPYRVTMQGTDPSVLAPDHPARVHPDWVVPYGGRLYYDPGVPAVREHTVDVIMEAVRRYDIDGVHFDDYFYPYPVAGRQFPDAETFAAYGDGFATIQDWRRDNITRLIEEVDDRVHREKPWIQFGVSPFGVWRNASSDPRGSATSAGVQTYDDLYADTRLWVEHGSVDYMLPQVYWSIGFQPAAYDVLVPWWSQVVAGSGVALWIGQATHKVGTSTQSPGWSDPMEMTRHLDLDERHPQVTGDVYFSARQVRADRLGHWDLLQKNHYPRPALPPALHPGSTPRVTAPYAVRARPVATGTSLRWRHSGDDAGFAIYRADGAGLGPCAVATPENLVAVVGDGARRWVDRTGSTDSTYVVTALARDNTESAPSRPEEGP